MRGASWRSLWLNPPWILQVGYLAPSSVIPPGSHGSYATRERWTGALARCASASRPAIAYRGHDLGRLRKSRALLGDDLGIVDPDAELPGAARHELCRDPELALELSCHPGSARFVPSSRAVADRDHHVPSLARGST